VVSEIAGFGGLDLQFVCRDEVCGKGRGNRGVDRNRIIEVHTLGWGLMRDGVWETHHEAADMIGLENRKRFKLDGTWQNGRKMYIAIIVNQNCTCTSLSGWIV
jgi:hypothetical protein